MSISPHSHVSPCSYGHPLSFLRVSPLSHVHLSLSNVLYFPVSIPSHGHPPPFLHVPPPFLHVPPPFPCFPPVPVSPLSPLPALTPLSAPPSVEPTEAGDYKLCFDNSFSTISEKLVFFELIFDSAREEDEEEEEDGGEEGDGWAEAAVPEDTLDIKIEDIKVGRGSCPPPWQHQGWTR